MKIPENEQEQFKVYLRILEKIFKKEITEERKRSIIEKIDKELQSNVEKDAVTITNVISYIFKVWTEEITLILQERQSKKVPTVFNIGDLVRGKVIYTKLEDLIEGV